MSAVVRRGKARTPKGYSLADLRGAYVAKVSGDHWGFAVFDAAGIQVSGVRGSHAEAVNQLDGWRRTLSRKDRKCLSCTAIFQSEGAHNRMCDRCRATKSDMRGGV